MGFGLVRTLAPKLLKPVGQLVKDVPSSIYAPMKPAMQSKATEGGKKLAGRWAVPNRQSTLPTSLGPTAYSPSIPPLVTTASAAKAGTGGYGGPVNKGMELLPLSKGAVSPAAKNVASKADDVSKPAVGAAQSLWSRLPFKKTMAGAGILGGLYALGGQFGDDAPQATEQMEQQQYIPQYPMYGMGGSGSSGLLDFARSEANASIQPQLDIIQAQLDALDAEEQEAIAKLNQRYAQYRQNVQGDIAQNRQMASLEEQREQGAREQMADELEAMIAGIGTFAIEGQSAEDVAESKLDLASQNMRQAKADEQYQDILTDTLDTSLPEIAAAQPVNQERNIADIEDKYRAERLALLNAQAQLLGQVPTTTASLASAYGDVAGASGGMATDEVSKEMNRRIEFAKDVMGPEVIFMQDAGGDKPIPVTRADIKLATPAGQQFLYGPQADINLLNTPLTENEIYSYMTEFANYTPEEAQRLIDESMGR